jgi:hypothetical protein
MHCSWLKEVATDRSGHMFFKQRIIAWNSLPQDVVAAESVNCFKWRFDLWKQSAISGAIWAERPTGSLMMMMNTIVGWYEVYNVSSRAKATVYCKSDDTKLDRIHYPCTIRSRLCVDSIRRHYNCRVLVHKLMYDPLMHLAWKSLISNKGRNVCRF